MKKVRMVQGGMLGLAALLIRCASPPVAPPPADHAPVAVTARLAVDSLLDSATLVSQLGSIATVGGTRSLCLTGTLPNDTTWLARAAYPHGATVPLTGRIPWAVDTAHADIWVSIQVVDSAGDVMAVWTWVNGPCGDTLKVWRFASPAISARVLQ